MKKLATALLLYGATSFISPAFATLIINEVDYDQASIDKAEFIELFNQNPYSINLSSYSIDLINGNSGGNSIYDSIALPSINLAAGDYYVICGNSDNVINCDLEGSKSSNLIQNGSPDAIALLLNDALIDSLSYEGDTAFPYTEGSGSGLIDNPNQDYMGLSLWPNGITSKQNNLDFIFSCITPGMANTNQDSNCLEPKKTTNIPAPPSIFLLSLGLLGLAHHRFNKKSYARQKSKTFNRAKHRQIPMHITNVNCQTILECHQIIY